MRTNWKRTIKTTAEELLMDKRAIGGSFDVILDVAVSYESPDRSTGYPGGMVVDEFKGQVYIEYDDDMEVVRSLTAKEAESLPDFAELQKALAAWVDDNENHLFSIASDEEEGAREYAEEQKFQRYRDGE